MASKYYRNKGFTLAEILVTLGVIGVIASMTVPTLIQNIQDAQLKTAWRKAFVDLSSASKLLLLDNSNDLKDVFTSHNQMKDVVSRYFNYVRLCNYSQSDDICWHKYGNWRRLNGELTTPGSPASIVLNNGTLIRLFFLSKSCTYNEPSWAGMPICAFMNVDVNGFKSPNITGKDVFSLYVTQRGFVPIGTQEDTKYNPSQDCIEGSTESTNTGSSCAAKYLYQ